MLAYIPTSPDFDGRLHEAKRIALRTGRMAFVIWNRQRKCFFAVEDWVAAALAHERHYTDTAAQVTPDGRVLYMMGFEDDPPDWPHRSVQVNARRIAVHG